MAQDTGPEWEGMGRACLERGVASRHQGKSEDRLLSNEIGGSEISGTVRLQAGPLCGENREQIQASNFLPTLTVFGLDSPRTFVERKEKKFTSFPKKESSDPN